MNNYINNWVNKDVLIPRASREPHRARIICMVKFTDSTNDSYPYLQGAQHSDGEWYCNVFWIENHKDEVIIMEDLSSTNYFDEERFNNTTKKRMSKHISIKDILKLNSHLPNLVIDVVELKENN